jgi:hypothetical protein
MRERLSQKQLKRNLDVRFHVRFTPNSDRKSRHAQMVMSALPPKADMRSATNDVRFGPEADISSKQKDRLAAVSPKFDPVF